MRWIVFLVAISVIVFVSRPYVRGASFVVRAAGVQGLPRRAADRMASDTRTREIDIATAAAPIRARVYEPSRRSGRTALLVAPLDPAGIDAPAVTSIARQLAASGVTVVTPSIAELMRLEIVPAATAAIEQAALGVASDAALTADGKVALIGIGFSGGLAVVAAGRPALASRVAYVASIGGHHDLPRVLRYL